MFQRNRPHIKSHTIQAESNYKLGFCLGKTMADEVQTIASLVRNRVFYDFQKVRSSICFLEAHYPELLKELMGLSVGSGVDLKLLVALNFFEETIWNEAEHCSLIFRKDLQRRVLIGWNEDGFSVYRGWMGLVEAQTPTLRFLTLSYPGLLCGDTLTVTGRGLILALQSIKVASYPDRPGLPRGLAGRLFLECANLQEILSLGKRLSRMQHFSHGFHLFAYDAITQGMLSMEVHPDLGMRHQYQIHPLFFSHTNHFLLPDWGKTESAQPSVSKNSYSRLAYLDLFKKVPLTPAVLAAILSNRPPSGVFGGKDICREGTTVTLHGQVLMIPRPGAGGMPILWTSPGIPSKSQFADWEQRKINFA